MPAILERLVSQLEAKGHDKKSAFAIATVALQRSGNLYRGSSKATPKGIRRGAMTPGARAKDRSSKYSKRRHKPSAYKYNKKRNIATLKR